MTHAGLFDAADVAIRWCEGVGSSGTATEKELAVRQRIAERHLRILLVDDISNFRAALCARLVRDYEASVDDDDCGEDALKRAYVEYDVVFIDVLMPGMSGIEVCKELQRRQITAKIALMSTHLDNALAAEANDVAFYDKTSIPMLEKILLDAAGGNSA